VENEYIEDTEQILRLILEKIIIS